MLGIVLHSLFEVKLRLLPRQQGTEVVMRYIVIWSKPKGRKGKVCVCVCVRV